MVQVERQYLVALLEIYDYVVHSLHGIHKLAIVEFFTSTEDFQATETNIKTKKCRKCIKIPNTAYPKLMLRFNQQIKKGTANRYEDNV
jgi:hypothetical protein